VLNAMGSRGWDYLWQLAKAAPDVEQAAQAVHLTTSIRVNAIKAGTTGPGGTRTLTMSSVDFRNTRTNLSDPHFRSQLNQSMHSAGRIADIDSEEDDDPFQAMPDEVVAALVAENQPKLAAALASRRIVPDNATVSEESPALQSPLPTVSRKRLTSEPERHSLGGKHLSAILSLPSPTPETPTTNSEPAGDEDMGSVHSLPSPTPDPPKSDIEPADDEDAGRALNREGVQMTLTTKPDSHLRWGNPSGGQPDVSQAAGVGTAAATILRFPPAMQSTEFPDNQIAHLIEDGYELGSHFEAIVGRGSLEALQRGQELRFRVFDLDDLTRAAIRADIELYLDHCPLDRLTPGCLLPNMVHCAGQQLARRSVRLWVVAACLFATDEVLAVPRPGEFAGTLDGNGNPVVNDDWQFATISRSQGIRIPWLCVSFVPSSFVTSGPGQQSEQIGRQLIREAHIGLRSVLYREGEGFADSAFIDTLATPVICSSPVSQALCGMVGWEHATVTEHIELISTSEVFRTYCNDLAFLEATAVMHSVRLSLQRDYLRRGSASIVAKKIARLGQGTADMAFFNSLREALGDRWQEDEEQGSMG
jgi:hypothetical protein